jgi:hypothetical protein
MVVTITVKLYNRAWVLIITKTTQSKILLLFSLPPLFRTPMMFKHSFLFKVKVPTTIIIMSRRMNNIIIKLSNTITVSTITVPVLHLHKKKLLLDYWRIFCLVYGMCLYVRLLHILGPHDSVRRISVCIPICTFVLFYNIVYYDKYFIICLITSIW